MKILLISDIHANFPALQAVWNHFREPFDLILNGGDTTVYGPFPNQTIDWLRDHEVVSILGNTDRHVLQLLEGRTFKKPRKAEKRVMYGWTATELSEPNREWLRSQPVSQVLPPISRGANRGCDVSLAMHHGSPADPDEFLFATTPQCRFDELAGLTAQRLITVGHSHSQFHRYSNGVHFINPGSVGRMFDGKISAACAVLSLVGHEIDVELHRIAYPVEAVIAELHRVRLPAIYLEMYRRGRKLN